jgi:DNA-binding beta-propeller fold protein YncE
MAVAGPAWASEGKLVYKACVSASHKSGCPGPLRASLSSADDVAVSPDGKSVYAVSYVGVSTFKRRSTGALVYKDCIAYKDTVGCPHPSITALGGGYSIAVSPDGHSVYASGSPGRPEEGNALVRFKRHRNGSLTFGSCVASNDRYGCGSVEPKMPDYPTLAVSPDSTSVYIGGDDSINWFTPIGAGGLEFAGCIKNGKKPSRRCASARHRSLHNLYDLVVSADGKTLYAASSVRNGAVTWFNRHSSGDLSGGGCFAQFGYYDCPRPPHNTLYWPEGLGISPSDHSVYVGTAGGVTRFERDHRGRLRFSGCIAGGEYSGCPGAIYKPISSPQALAVDPASGSIYVADGLSTISYLEPTHRGGLRFVNCVSAQRSECAHGPAALRGNMGIAASPKDGSLYVSAWDGQAASWLKVKR